MSLRDKTHDEWALLKNVAEGYELDLITSMLAQLNIPVQKKSRGAGAYTSVYMGMSITGYDIYVPANRLLEARELLENIEPLETDLMEEAEVEVLDEPSGYILRYRDLFKKLLIVFFIIPSIIAILYFLYHSLIPVFKGFFS